MNIFGNRSEMTCIVLSGALNSTHSLDSGIGQFVKKRQSDKLIVWRVDRYV